MTPDNDFYSDKECGEFTGNILTLLASLFPPESGIRISSRASVMTQWRLMVRTLKHGPVGHFIWTETWVVSILKDVFEELYQGYPRDGRYPEIYNEGYHHGLPMVCVGMIDKESITVWLPAPKRADAQ